MAAKVFQAVADPYDLHTHHHQMKSYAHFGAKCWKTPQLRYQKKTICREKPTNLQRFTEPLTPLPPQPRSRVSSGSRVTSISVGILHISWAFTRNHPIKTAKRWTCFFQWVHVSGTFKFTKTDFFRTLGLKQNSQVSVLVI